MPTPPPAHPTPTSGDFDISALLPVPISCLLRAPALLAEVLSLCGIQLHGRNCTWYVIMDLKITPSGQTIVKPTALGPVANTDTKLLIYGLFQKGRVLAQDGNLTPALSQNRA